MTEITTSANEGNYVNTSWITTGLITAGGLALSTLFGADPVTTVTVGAGVVLASYAASGLANISEWLYDNSGVGFGIRTLMGELDSAPDLILKAGLFAAVTAIGFAVAPMIAIPGASGIILNDMLIAGIAGTAATAIGGWLTGNFNSTTTRITSALSIGMIGSGSLIENAYINVTPHDVASLTR